MNSVTSIRNIQDDFRRNIQKIPRLLWSGNERILTLSVAASGHEATWNLRVRNDGRVYYHSDGGNDYLLNYQ